MHRFEIGQHKPLESKSSGELAPLRKVAPKHVPVQSGNFRPEDRLYPYGKVKEAQEQKAKEKE